MAALDFPTGFLWGVATAAHQVEGSNTNNNWWAWEQQGKIHDRDSARVACDWWRHAERDFDLAADMGLGALRLSIEWSRVEPRPGEWDDGAIARYREMLSALRARKIVPLVTLHHFTDPLWLKGGFLGRDAVARFVRFSRRVAEELGDLFDLYCTFNEPNVYAFFGYVDGSFPPGRRGDVRAMLKVQASMARAHLEAYEAIRGARPGAKIGFAQNYNVFDPARPRSPLDRLAAQTLDAAFNEFFTRRASRACDWAGFNAYYREVVRVDRHAPFVHHLAAPGTRRGDSPPKGEWGELYPQGIARVAQRLARLDKPIYVTESGVADRSDRVRPWVIASAVRALHDAIGRGADVRGYFHWTLVDNFEWLHGYSTRFGLVELDVETQTRTPRPSAALYARIAKANALTPEMLREFEPDVMAAAFPT